MTLMRMSKFGDWTRAGVVLQTLSSGGITEAFSAQMRDDGELVLKTIIGHIEKQDLNWVPLSKETIALKNGDETIYVETGFLKDNLKVRKVRAPKNGITYFIGADAWTKHEPSGLKFSDLMIYLEYGTDRIPARPLIKPSLDEVKSTIEKHWRGSLRHLLK